MEEIIVVPKSQLQNIVLESVATALHHFTPNAVAPAPFSLPRFCGYKRVKDELFPDIADSTLRQMIAKDETMGFFKFGKVLQCDTTILLEWVEKQRAKSASTSEDIEQSFSRKHSVSRKGGRITA